VSRRFLVRIVLVVAVLAALVPAAPAHGQQMGGATLTVVRGTAAVVRPDGTTVAPAPSGLSLDVGDQITAQSQAKALVTFFDGTEIELAADTSLILREMTTAGTRTSIAVETLVGSTVHRVVASLDPGSSYQVQSGGSVALVRGTVFSHTTEPNGDVTVSLQQCGQRPGAPPTDRCLEFPQPGRLMRTGETCTLAQRGAVSTLTCRSSSRQRQRSSSHSP
jgi:hypothetical protein